MRWGQSKYFEVKYAWEWLSRLFKAKLGPMTIINIAMAIKLEEKWLGLEKKNQQHMLSTMTSIKRQQPNVSILIGFVTDCRILREYIIFQIFFCFFFKYLNLDNSAFIYPHNSIGVSNWNCWRFYLFHCMIKHARNRFSRWMFVWMIAPQSIK